MVRGTTIISGGSATTTAGGPTLMLTFTPEKAVPAAKTVNSSANVTQTIRPAFSRSLIPTSSRTYRDLLSTPIPPWDGRRREIFTFPRYVATGPIIPDTESLSEERPVRFRGTPRLPGGRG